jgi:hypothetical protein
MLLGLDIAAARIHVTAAGGAASWVDVHGQDARRNGFLVTRESHQKSTKIRKKGNDYVEEH